MTYPGPTEPDDAARQARLGNQYAAIFQLMSDGGWRSLDQISQAVQRDYGVRCPPASVSAQLRHMRKGKFGGHVVDKRHVAHGLYLYQLKAARKQQELFR